MQMVLIHKPFTARTGVCSVVAKFLE